DHDGPALPQDVAAEAADAGRAPGAVVIEELVAAVPVPRRDELESDLARLIGAQSLFCERHQLAVHARPEHVTGLDVQVGCAALDRGLEDLDHAERPLWGARAGGRRTGERRGAERRARRRSGIPDLRRTIYQ